MDALLLAHHPFATFDTMLHTEFKMYFHYSTHSAYYKGYKIICPKLKQGDK